MVFQQQIQLRTRGHRDMHDLTQQVGQVVHVERAPRSSRQSIGAR